jgi:hypothetical protein
MIDWLTAIGEMPLFLIHGQAGHGGIARACGQPLTVRCHFFNPAPFQVRGGDASAASTLEADPFSCQTLPCCVCRFSGGQMETILATRRRDRNPALFVCRPASGEIAPRRHDGGLGQDKIYRTRRRSNHACARTFCA